MKKNIYYFDQLRALAIILVVNIHVAAPTLYLFNSSELGFLTGSILNLLSRSSVPIFFMISGALLLDKIESNKVFFKKRMNKILIPSLFWEVVYIIWFNKEDLSAINMKLVAGNIISGNIYYHYWFIYTILGLYLVTPIFRKYIQNASRREIEYFLAIWFACTSVDMILYKAFDIHIGINLQYVGAYLGFFVLGYYLYKYDINLKIRKALYYFTIPALLLTGCLMYQLTQQNAGNVDLFFFDYFNPVIILMSVVVFLLFKHKENASKVNKLIHIISFASFGIYLIHPIVIELLNSPGFYNAFGFVVNYTLINTLLGILITDFCVILFSLLMVLIIKKIPFIRNIF